jgi:hypothetical protein
MPESLVLIHPPIAHRARLQDLNCGAGAHAAGA